jgi:hypothetical protein
MDSNHDKVIQSHQNRRPLASANPFEFALPVDTLSPEVDRVTRRFRSSGRTAVYRFISQPALVLEMFTRVRDNCIITALKFDYAF